MGPEQEPHPTPDGYPHGHGHAAAPPHAAAAAAPPPPAAAPAEQPAPGLLQQEAVQHRDVARALLTATGLRPLAAHAPQAQGTGHQQQDGGDGVNQQRRGQRNRVDGECSDILSTILSRSKRISHLGILLTAFSSTFLTETKATANVRGICIFIRPPDRNTNG